MIVSDLIAALHNRRGNRRVLIPGQQWGWSDLAGAHAQTLTFWPVADRASGAWIVGGGDEPRQHREPCLILVPQPSLRRLPNATAHGGLRRRYGSYTGDFDWPTRRSR
jgi:hypothetical protein